MRKNLLKSLLILLLFLLPNIAFTQWQYDGSSEYLFKYGEKLYKQGDIKSAILELKKSLIVNPNNRNADELLKKILGEENIEKPKHNYAQEKDLEIKELNQQIEVSKQQLDNTKKDIRDKESLIKELRTTHKVKDAELTGLTKQLVNFNLEKEKAVKEQQDALKGLNQELVLSKQELDNANKEIRAKESLIKEFQDKITSLEQTLNGKARDYANKLNAPQLTTQTKDTGLTRLREELNAVINDKEKAIKEKDSYLDNLNQQIEASAEQLDSANISIKARDSLVKELENKTASLEQTLRDKTSQYSDKIRASELASQAKEAELSGLKEELASLTADKENIINEINGLNQQLEASKEQLDNAGKNIQTNESLIEELRLADQNKDKELADLKAQLLSANENIKAKEYLINGLEDKIISAKQDSQERLDNANKDIRARELFIKDLKERIFSLERMLEADNVKIKKLEDDLAALLESSEAEHIAEAEKLKKIIVELNDKLQKQIKDYEYKLEIAQKGLVVTVLTDILFNSGSADITNEGKYILNKIAQVLKESAADNDIAIEGHTDNQPIKYSGWRSNWELSSARSLSVLHYLIDNCDLNPDRLSANGYGEFSPVAENNGYEGNKANRRVEIIIKPEIIRIKPR